MRGFIAECPQAKGWPEDFEYCGFHAVIKKREDPAAMNESTRGIFIRCSRHLHNTIQREKSRQGQLRHDCSSKVKSIVTMREGHQHGGASHNVERRAPI
jgi:hypothetical protein